jgi:ferredoxin-type protein NapG
MDRKQFFEVAFKKLIGKGLELVEDSSFFQALEKLGEEPKISKKKERPPGASSNDKEFQRLCTGCDACMIACPVNVILIEDLEKRFPLIYPDENPCILCEDRPCITACPTGALKKHQRLL